MKSFLCDPPCPQRLKESDYPESMPFCMSLNPKGGGEDQSHRPLATSFYLHLSHRRRMKGSHAYFGD